MSFRNNSFLRFCNTNNNGNQSSQNQICRFDLRGYCYFGNHCRYVHINPNDSARNNICTDNFTRSSLVSETIQMGRSSSNNGNVGRNKITSEPRDSQSKVKAGHDNLDFKTRANTSEIVNGEGLPSDKEINQDSTLAGATCSNWDHVDESGKLTSKPPPANLHKTSSLNAQAKEFSLFNSNRGTKTEINEGNSQVNTEISYDLPKIKKEDSKFSSDMKQQLDSESEMLLAIEKSKDKACGICMDIVVEKLPANLRVFGILPNCNHVFCLSCIRTWRQEHQFENKIIKSCPECRVRSEFVTPSKYWIDKEEAKLKFIEEYKKRLSSRPCKFFKHGKGYCTYDDKCFYLHAYPDGRKIERQSNRLRQKHRSTKDAEQFIEAVQALLLAEFLEDCDLYDDLDLSFNSDYLEDSSDESFLELMFD